MVVTAATALLLATTSTCVRADAAVTGSADAVKIEARDSSVADVLDALGRAFGLKYRSSVELTQPVSGTFEGPVLKVLSRLLVNYDYVTKHVGPDNSIEVIVIKSVGKESTKKISTLPSYSPPPMNGGAAPSGNAAPAGGPYPDPAWRARSYSRGLKMNPVPSR